MSDDYLWDGSGEPDPEVQRLERLLGRFRSSRPMPEIPTRAPDLQEEGPRRRRLFFFSRRRSEARPRVEVRSYRRRLAVAAAILVMVAASWFVFRREHTAWDVVALEGAPTVGSDAIRDTGRLAVGQWLETDASSRAKLAIGVIGEARIEPNSRIRLLKAAMTEHRLGLARGAIHVTVWAPARNFFVDTPSAVAVDLGCTYTLEVDDEGASLLSVTMGWVAFEFNGRESFVPADAFCITRPSVGPGTPYYGTASESFRDALIKLDFETQDPAERRAILERLLGEARKEDAFTLWHLLTRLPGPERESVYERLADLVSPPPGVTREGVLRGDRAMLDRWWDELGLDDASWYRFWKGPIFQPSK